MKRTLFIIVLGLGLGATCFGVLYHSRTAPYRELQQTCGPELAWIKMEFKLNDADFKRVRVLHQAYKPVCAAYCRKIDRQDRELAGLLNVSTNVTPEIQKLLSESAELREECHAQMLKHFFAVSQAMPPEQGRRYLAWVQTEMMTPTHQSMFSDTGKESMHGGDAQ